MSARDELLSYIGGLNYSICSERCVACNCAESDAKEASQMVDDFAHELAEQIRTEVAPIAVFRSEDMRALVKYGRRLANLIDPEVP
jgi:hypothetical protein